MNSEQWKLASSCVPKPLQNSPPRLLRVSGNALQVAILAKFCRYS